MSADTQTPNRRQQARSPSAPDTHAEPIEAKLTALASCAGCAAKLGQALLAEVVHQLPQKRNPNLIVGADTADDAAIYQLNEDLALVQTVDFFPPIVDDPWDYGQIAATNALSDVYAMGGRPITAMNLVGMPTDRLPMPVIHRILEGGAAKVKEANCALAGGHTIRSPEPIYGLSVTGLIHPRRIMTNANARPGDWLLLTKPLGAGIATTAMKRGIASPALHRTVIASMRRLNTAGAELAEQRLVTAATDITGFGLLGHLASLCRASNVGAEIWASDLPVFGDEIFDLIRRDCIPGGTRTNLATADDIVAWNDVDPIHRILMADAQTSGGLLLCVRPHDIDFVRDILKTHRARCAVIGHIIPAHPPRIITHP